MNDTLMSAINILNQSSVSSSIKPDPNWLYSSIAQCSAAIVGIIGAFITSRVIMLSGEKSALSKRKRELELEIKTLEQQNKEMNEYCNKFEREDTEDDISEFLEDLEVSKILEEDIPKTFDEFWKAYCEFHDNDETRCKKMHKKILKEKYERLEQNAGREKRQ